MPLTSRISTVARSWARWWMRAAAGVVILPLLLSAAACTDRPTYEPVPAELCDDIAPLLGDLLARFQVILEDEVMSSHFGGRSESTHCYFRAGGWPTFVTLLVVTQTHPSAEDAEHSHQVTTGISGSSGYESIGSVEGVGEQAEAHLLDSGGPVTHYQLASQDRNLSIFVTLEVQHDPRPTAGELEDLVTPLTVEILELLPRSR